MRLADNSADYSRIASRSRELFLNQHQENCRKTDRLFAGLLAFQFLVGIAAAIWISPLTWSGRSSAVHPHVWAAVGLGSLITIFPIFLAITRPGQASTRHVIAAGQMLWSALLVHLTGGRIETHFHVFGSLAFLAFYRDWRVLVTATGVIAADHLLRGMFWPESVFGVVVRNDWRWLEHAGWVIFEDIMLFTVCRIGIKEAKEISTRRAETELLSEHRNEELKEFESLVNTVEGMVWESEASSMKFTFASRQTELLFGYPPAKWTESTGFWKTLLHPDDKARVENAFARKAAGTTFFEEEYRILSSSGKYLTVRNAVSVVAEPGRPVQFRGIMTDITERKRLESLKNEFISNVSHELRTPLTSIRGSLGLVASGVTGTLPPKTMGMINLAVKNTERLVRLIGDILDIQKIESGNMPITLRLTELMPLVVQSIESHQGYAQSCGVKVVMTESLPGAMVRVDSDRLTQVIANLLSNACKFSPKGGSVTLSVTRREKRVRISVSDLGPGIPDSFKSRIFQKFAQAETSDTRLVQGKGTGLGLSISKAITEAMGGTIDFESEVGRGSTFFIDLPEEARIMTSASEIRGGRKGRILVVDDEVDICAVLQAMLEQEGYEADVAFSAAEAQECLNLKHYDGMTLDLSMPGKDGLTFIRELRQRPETQQLPIVVVSAYSDDGKHILSGEAFDVVDWLSKPIDPSLLREALESGLNQIPTDQPRILHVEDDPAIQEVVRASLSDQIDLVAVGTLKDAVERVKAEIFDLVILDLLLPDGSGLDLLPALRSSAKPSTPVLVFSAQEISPLAARHVSAVLETSTTSNEKLATSIKGFLGSHRIPQVKRDGGPGYEGSTGPLAKLRGEFIAAAKESS